MDTHTGSTSPVLQNTRWFVNPRPKPKAPARLFFFPYAGAGPAAFAPLMALLPRDIDGWVAHYPGRGSRHSEPAVRNLTNLVEGIVESIGPLLNGCCAFYGHSLGALVAFEAARSLRRRGLPQPAIIFASACAAPQVRRQGRLHTHPDPDFLEAVKEFHGVSWDLIRQPEAIALLVPILRADFTALETYSYRTGRPLACRIVVLGGQDDRQVSRSELEGWKSQTTSDFAIEYFPGDHFFINTVTTAIVDTITAEIRKAAP